MSPDQIFSVANAAALCCWLLLIVLPGRAWVNRVVAGVAVPAAFAALYSVHHRDRISSAAMADFHRYRTWRGSSPIPWLLLAGWIHYLAFDLLVGSWEARDARGRGISHVFVVPCLILTFLFGPAGMAAVSRRSNALLRRAHLNPVADRYRRRLERAGAKLEHAV